MVSVVLKYELGVSYILEQTVFKGVRMCVCLNIYACVNVCMLVVLYFCACGYMLFYLGLEILPFGKESKDATKRKNSTIACTATLPKEFHKPRT